MSTNELLYPGQTLTLGMFGSIPAGNPEPDLCCTSSLCLDEAALACSFIDQLPSGPMWDENKERAKEVIAANGRVPVPGDAFQFHCTSMVSYAVYGSQTLKCLVDEVLTPRIVESNPLTAVNTIDDWLERLGWSDFYAGFSTEDFLAGLSQCERDRDAAEQHEVFYASEFTEEFDCALKHATIASLLRIKRGFIKNLEGVNWAIAPLDAVMTPVYSEEIQEYLDGVCEFKEPGEPCWQDSIHFEISSVSNEIPACPTYETFCRAEPRGVVATPQLYTREGSPPITLRPNILVAECLVKSLIPTLCPEFTVNL